MIEDRIKGVENSKSTRVTDAKGAKVKQLLLCFIISSAIHGWSARRLPTPDGADGRAECGKRVPRKTGDQLGLEPLPLSKIRDRSTEGNGRPHRTAVFDF